MKVIVSFMLLATLFVLASPANAQVSEAQMKTIQDSLVQAMQTGQESAVKDATGKIIQTRIEFADQKQTLQVGYENNSLSSLTFENGVKATILRNESGSLKGFSFPHGSQLIFLWKKVHGLDYQVPDGLKFITPNGSEHTLHLGEMRSMGSQKKVSPFVKARFLLDPEADCQFAVAKATLAATAAAVACAGDPYSATCIVTTASALVLAADAVRICGRIGGEGGGGNCSTPICPVEPINQW